MAMSSRLMLVLAGGAALSACNTVHPISQSSDPGFGEAFRYDMAVQTIDPDPVYSETDAQPGSSGVKGAEAMKRYRTDRVKDVEIMSVDSASGSGPN
jgi:hypothetical protein